MVIAVPALRERRGSREAVTAEVVEEVPLVLTFNGRQIMSAMTVPGRPADLALGYLFSEQIIEGMDEVESVMVEGQAVKVLTHDPFRVVVSRRVVVSGCGGAAARIREQHLPVIATAMPLSAETIRTRVNDLLVAVPLAATGDLYAAALVMPDAVWSAEDHGLQNAVNRLIGRRLQEGAEADAWVAASGRITAEIVMTCAVAGFPVLASFGRATALAIDLAEKAGITLIGEVTGAGMIVYTHPERVVG
ncbi:formate dehydrogenase accessory sulfurtransferase FdhD [Methanosphaerula palustris]|uniref:Formate dehydrogenase subunit FdhD n=1 Tax=Methanosphaerula palustris (strain ATCC BAA-1556 / DSM 19958 / E1-9c) TaxID=521011 RepID=B8GIL4_METPE|nr:formate dehydrogenase accessory sulfurtransferase FdhD [Methanosphaerula palustris]ACL16827.1 formate dehydrogenase subunit FdhD [Methanosphaerula palustris E1-9c]